MIQLKQFLFQFFTYPDLFEVDRNFSSLFKKDFMLRVLELQQRIEALVGTTDSGERVSLSDVCHAPLRPDNDACNVQSVWSYWQDSKEEMLRAETNKKTGHEDTYLDHFMLCSRNPTLQTAPTAMAQGCMSKGGIPVQPYFVLGGYGNKKEEGEGYTSQ